jgi:hypothetical protein
MWGPVCCGTRREREAGGRAQADVSDEDETGEQHDVVGASEDEKASGEGDEAAEGYQPSENEGHEA